VLDFKVRNAVLGALRSIGYFGLLPVVRCTMRERLLSWIEAIVAKFMIFATTHPGHKIKVIWQVHISGAKRWAVFNC
jgi:hypothetical protein